MKKFFVIGNPINHSLSPKIHNYWIKKNTIDAIYNKKKLEKSEIKEFIKKVKKEKISGLNVTVPFKKTVIPYLDELSFEAKETHSVNTIIMNDNRLIGHNTDIFGFTKAIQNLNFEIKNKKIFILGAGGVVPSIVFALSKMRVSEITISNRTKDKAVNLKSKFKNLKVIDWGEIANFDVIINATSLGLNNEVINLDFKNIGKNKLFYDVIYNPTETNFLKEGKKLGHLSENGKLMFVFQASESFKLWHGIKPKIDNETIKILNND